MREIYTGCPIKNSPTLKPCNFGSFQYFIKRFSLYKSQSVVLYACFSARLETFRICLDVVAKLGHFLKKYHLNFWENRQICVECKHDKSMIIVYLNPDPWCGKILPPITSRNDNTCSYWAEYRDFTWVIKVSMHFSIFSGCHRSSWPFLSF